MNTEKICITADDIARNDVQAQTQLVPLMPAAAETSVKLWSSLRFRIVTICTVAVLLGAFALAFFLTAERTLSLEEWKDAELRQLNAELVTSKKLKPYIERIHPLVTFTGAGVKAITVSTVDGSKRVGKNGSNIAEVEFIVTYHWEGPVQKNGYTEVLYVWDMQANRLKTSRYLATSAVMNLDDIDWFTIGAEIARVLIEEN